MPELRNNQGDLWTVPCKGLGPDKEVWRSPEKFSDAECDTARRQCRMVCSRRAACIRDALAPPKPMTPASQGIWGGEQFPGSFDEALNNTYDRLQAIHKVLTGHDVPGFKHRRRAVAAATGDLAPEAPQATDVTVIPVPAVKPSGTPERIVVGEPLYLFAISA